MSLETTSGLDSDWDASSVFTLIFSESEDWDDAHCRELLELDIEIMVRKKKERRRKRRRKRRKEEKKKERTAEIALFLCFINSKDYKLNQKTYLKGI